MPQHDAGSERLHFEVYQTDRVHFTSTLCGGGDWHWRYSSSAGTVLADCGGYSSEKECMTAVNGLRRGASSATLSGRA
jgi:uncharacterized protein YegP (UPF0339 family)